MEKIIKNKITWDYNDFERNELESKNEFNYQVREKLTKETDYDEWYKNLGGYVLEIISENAWDKFKDDDVNDFKTLEIKYSVYSGNLIDFLEDDDKCDKCFDNFIELISSLHDNTTSLNNLIKLTYDKKQEKFSELTNHYGNKIDVLTITDEQANFIYNFTPDFLEESRANDDLNTDEKRFMELWEGTSEIPELNLILINFFNKLLKKENLGIIKFSSADKG